MTKSRVVIAVTGAAVLAVGVVTFAATRSDACAQWQEDVLAAYNEPTGGVFQHINLLDIEVVAQRVPGRPDGCPVPEHPEGAQPDTQDPAIEDGAEIAGHEVKVFDEWGDDHREGDLDYRQTPPVNGPHAPVPAPCGTYAEQIPDEVFVHTLEHGVVAVLFDPSLDASEIREIEDSVRASGTTLSAPYAGMNADVVLASWGTLLEVGTFDEDVADEFVERVEGEAPEWEAGCGWPPSKDSFVDDATG